VTIDQGTTALVRTPTPGPIGVDGGYRGPSGRSSPPGAHGLLSDAAVESVEDLTKAVADFRRSETWSTLQPIASRLLGQYSFGLGVQGTFVLPKSYVAQGITDSGGDVRKLEQLLGLDKGYLGDNPVLVEVAKPTGLRMPSGNEPGANLRWTAGGYTSGGVPEAVVDQI
jgi:hypothetical protein